MASNSKKRPPATSSSLAASLFGESDTRKKNKLRGDPSSLTSSLFGESDAKNNDLFSNPADLDEKIAASAKSTPAARTETEGAPKVSREEILHRRATISTRDIIQNQLEIQRTPGDTHHFDQDLADDIRSTLSASGVALVKNMLNENAALRQIAQQAAAYHSRICTALEQRGLTWNDPRNNTETVRFHDVVVRCQGRMDARYPEFDGAAPFWESHGLLQRTVETVLYGGTDDAVHPQLVYAGFIFSAPGSVDQPWHQDGSPLFPDARTTAMLPTYAINVFVPLESADVETGPTEFVVGSHRDVTTTTHSDDNDDRVVALLPQTGDVVLYDYRICHRGTRNVSNRTRTVLYLMYARPWFKEHLNFGTEQLLE